MSDKSKGTGIGKQGSLEMEPSQKSQKGKWEKKSKPLKDVRSTSK